MRKLILLILVLAAMPLQAGWRRAGLYGADVRALVLDPRNPDTAYLGTSEGEVYVSVDGAKNWKNPRSGTPFPKYIVDNLSIDSRGRLWAACWGLWGGGVIAISSDGGRNWTRRDGGLEEFSVRALAIDPTDADHAVAGGLTGVYQTRDGGKSWIKISSRENVESLAIDPRTPDTIYVGTWRQAWRSDDGGKTWKHIAEGMVLDTDVFAINIDWMNPDNVWLSTCGWVYNSVDRGETWTRYRDGFNNRRIHAIELHPKDRDTVFAGSVAGLYRSVDGGKNFTLASDESLVVNSIAVHPKRPDRIILGTEGDGVYVSEDAGVTFNRSNSGLYDVRVAAVVPDPDTAKRLYAAVMFGNAASGIYRSNDGGETWAKLSQTRLPEIRSLIVQPSDEVRFVAATEKGLFWSADGVEWTEGFPAVRVEKVISYNRLRLFAATAEGVLTSKDSGRTWYPLSAMKEKTIDIAVGDLDGRKSLVALTTGAVAVYDGASWKFLENSPKQGRSIAIRRTATGEQILVGGSKGVIAGRMNGDKWTTVTTVPTAFVVPSLQTSLAVVDSDQNEIRITAHGEKADRITSPVDAGEIAGLATDPFDSDLLYLATSGHGIYIYRELATP